MCPLRASDRCLQEKRKTITGDDILFAMATLGFDNHIDPLRIYLQKYREVGYTAMYKTVPLHSLSPVQHTKTDKAGSPPLEETTLDELSVSSMPPLSTSNPFEVTMSNVPATMTGGASLENMSTTHMVRELCLCMAA